jgi:hypothetical protein
MRTDVGKPQLDLRDPMRVRRVFRFGEKTCAFCVRRQHTQSIKLSSPPGASCATWPMRALRGIEMAPSSGETSPFNRRSSVVLPAPLRDEADLVAGRDCGRCPFEDRFALDPVGEIIDMQHQARR